MNILKILKALSPRGLFSIYLACLILSESTLTTQGQWVTQTNMLRAGWNAVFTHVDASHATLDEQVGNDPSNPIQEIWLWQAAPSTGQFIDSPQIPTDTGTEWASWSRSSPGSGLRRLTANSAYLVLVDNGVPSYQWSVKGKPVTPTYRWTLTGLNFIGFPTLPSNPPSFDSFLALVPEVLQSPNLQIYQYPGGELGPANPVAIVSMLRSTPVRRDQAYWMRAGDIYNGYFGPFQILQMDPSGIRFGETRGQARFRLRNVTNGPLTNTLRLVASESPPTGQPRIEGPPPLLLRGPINTTNLTFSYTNLAVQGSPHQWILAAAGQPGSEVEVVIGLNRFQMSGNPGALFAGILRFTDLRGLSQVDMAVSAEKASTAGLWVGEAVAAYVSHYLKPFARTTDDADFAALLARLQLGQGINGYRYERDPNTGRVLVFGGPEQKTGSYLLDGPLKVDSGAVARPFPLRLIVHNDGSTARLLQKVFHGVGLGSNTVLTTRESLLLPSQLAEARRISAVHLPASAGNIPWNFSGAMQQGGSMTVTVPLSFDDQASNPFLHGYHPDHDNLNAQFDATLGRGLESYGVSRQFSLTFTTPENDFESLTSGSQNLGGNYAEVVTFQARDSQSRQYHVLGAFNLKRISHMATLTTQ